MKKRLSALLIAVICIAITAVGAFAYTPNTYPYLKNNFPNDTYFYGYLPNQNYGYHLAYQNDDDYSYYTCPKCGWYIVGVFVTLPTYIEDGLEYFDSDDIDGLYIIGDYSNTNTFAFHGYLSSRDSDGFSREIHNTDFECASQRNSIYNSLDVYTFEYYYGVNATMIYTHVYPFEDWTPPISNTLQVLGIRENSSIWTDVVGNYNNAQFSASNRDDYINFANRIININPFGNIYPITGSGDFEEGYNTGYSDGYELGIDVGYEEGNNVGYEEGYTSGNSQGYTNGFNVGRIQGQEDQEMLDGMFVDLFDGLFGSLEGFTSNLLSLGWGTLTIGALLGLLGVVLVTMLIIKIIRG